VLILYRIVGRGTSLMSNLKEGDRISLLGPLGKGFERPGGQGSPLLVSGGMGLAPLAFLAQDLGHRRATLLAGFASAPEVVPLDPLGLAGVPASIATDDGTRGHGGPVTDLLEDALDRSGHGISTVFTCGPMAMMKRVAALCLERGIPCQASMETPMACGVGACRGCAVKADSRENRPYFHACQDGPVFWIDSLDWGQL
jgi:dihydroorotate dehydrogenase electron transfer subunit